jgi:DNA polymerase III subunit alpha
MAFCHLHRHSEFSPLDGTGSANQYAAEAVKKEQEWLNISDHARLGGVLDHIHACRHPDKHEDPDDPAKKRSKDDRLTPLIGLEAFWRDDVNDDEISGSSANHLTIIAGSLKGWRSLMQLSSQSWVPRDRGGGFYGKACIDMPMFKRHAEDLIVCTGCVSSPLSQAILRGDDMYAKRWIEKMLTITNGRLWGEIMPHDFEDQRTVNAEVINYAAHYGFGLVATGDVHMPYKEWMDTQSVVRMATYKQTLTQRETKADAGEDTYTDEIDTIYLSSEDEIREMFEEFHEDIPEHIVDEAINNTVELARGVKWFQIGKATKLPKVTDSASEAEKIMRGWCEEGFEKLNEYVDDDKLHVYRERYEYEFDVLKEKGVLDYFILVGDFVRWAKSTDPLPGDDVPRRKIRVGLGRGSAAGCLVSYLVGITAIDPISWGLLFERFLNPDRVGMPDIDLDFETEELVYNIDDVPEDKRDDPAYKLDGRGLVKEYMKRKYGHEYVADIISYQTFAPRAVVQEVSKVYELPFGVVKTVTDSIGDTDRDLEKIASQNELVGKFKTKNPEVWKHCLRLEDSIMRDSRHAGGIVITDRPITEYMPTQTSQPSDKNAPRVTVTAWADRAAFPIVSDYGFVKIDVLGVKGLTKQEVAVELIREHYGEEFEPNDLGVLRDPYDVDPEVINCFTKGLTQGVFQFGSSGITKLMRHVKPDNAIDIAVVNALYRPGPVKIAFEYGDRKNGKRPVTYWHESLEPVLSETLGMIAFQEQVMEITKRVGNFSGGDADAMRKAISKLYRLPGDEAREFMEQWRQQWLQGCLDNGLKDKEAIEIWEKILEFAGYGFNKSHSASYGLQAIQDMHIKWHYPLASYASILTVDKKQKAEEQEEFLRALMREARILDVEIKPPDVNKSVRGWAIADNKLLYGLVAIDGMGGATAHEVMKARERKPFRDYQDFLERMPSNFSIKASTSLVKAGGFDNIDDREQLLRKIRKWPATTGRYKVKMDCGCTKTKSVKVDHHDDLEETAEDVMLGLSCRKHPDAKAEQWVEIDPWYTVAEWLKEHPGELPTDETIERTRTEILDLEREALKLTISTASVMSDYHEFIEERVYTEAEIEETPNHPKRKGNKHGMFCSCKDCEEAQLVVGGEVVGLKEITTKGGDKMAFVDMAFGVNSYDVTVFPSIYKKYRKMLKEQVPLLIAGHKDERPGHENVIAYDIMRVTDAAAEAGWEPAARPQIQKPTPIAKGKYIKLKKKAA